MDSLEIVVGLETFHIFFSTFKTLNLFQVSEDFPVFIDLENSLLSIQVKIYLQHFGGIDVYLI